MEQRNIFTKIIRFIAILLLGLTAVFHLLGGAGTSCVALFAEKYESMASIAPFKWLYIIFVLVTLVIGVVAVRATFRLARSKAGSYRDSLLILVVALFVSGAHMITSEILRGSSAPTSMRVYLNILTLVVFLVLRIPGIFDKIGFESSSSGSGSTIPGTALVVMGITTLTVHLWAGPTHIWADGVNYADVWHAQLGALGWGLVVLGLGMVLYRFFEPVLKAKERSQVLEG